MVDEYIRKQDAIDAFNRIKNTLKNPETAHYDTLMFYEIEDVLEDVEPADVVEVKHGEWIGVPETWGAFDIRYYCSECGKDAIINNSERYVLSDYCPHCFAKMDGKKRK